MQSADEIRAHVRIVGRVQGVGFRYATSEQARRLGLAGWVRNLDSGAVEAVFEGPREAVEAMVRWCTDGPPGAHVRDVQIAWDEPPEHLASFRIARTSFG
jgi:acylphosphatase